MWWFNGDCSCFGTNGMLGSQSQVFFLIWLDWRSLRWNLKLCCSLENIINRTWHCGEKFDSDQRVQISWRLLWFWATLEYTNTVRAKTKLAKGALPKCMLLLYKGLLGSILDYASVCYSRMAKKHFLVLERL
jgi:hypothetical protein